MEIPKLYDPTFYVDYVKIDAAFRDQTTVLAYLVRFWKFRHKTPSSFYHACLCYYMGWGGLWSDSAQFVVYSSSYWATFALIYIRDDAMIDLQSVRWWKYSLNDYFGFVGGFIWYLIYKTALQLGSALLFRPRESVGLLLTHKLVPIGIAIMFVFIVDRTWFGSTVPARLKHLTIQGASVILDWAYKGVLFARWSSSRLERFLVRIRSLQSKYEYVPLEPGEYRLLKLQRRLPFGQVRTKMIVITATTDCPYEAISYTWGDSTKFKGISIDGQQLQISAKAYDILKDCSSIWRSKHFWIDQVCINQSDPREKALQVSMMFDIYRRASSVVAHLGFAPLASSAVSMLIELIEHSQYDTSAFNLVMLNQIPGISVMWSGLMEMLSNPWFTRVWIIQEIAAAQKVKVVYGSYTLDWDVVKTAMMMLLRTGFRDQITVSATGVKVFQGLNQLQEIQMIKDEMNERDDLLQSLFYKLTPLGSLPHMLCRTVGFQATDPRDLIFAVQSLTYNDDIRVTPDYLKPVEDIYTDLAHHVLTKYHDPFCMMSSAGIGGERNLNLPTWVPDWTCNESHTPFNRNRHADVVGPIASALIKIKFPDEVKERKEHVRVGYEASGRTRADVTEVHGSGSKVVRIKGIIIDEVRLLNLIDQPPSSTNQDRIYSDNNGVAFNPTKCEMAYNWFQDVYRMATGDDFLIQEEMEEAFWRTLIGDIFEEKRPAPATVRDNYKAWVYVLENNKKVCDLIAEGQTDVEIPRHEEYLKAQAQSGEYIRAMGLCAAKKRFMVTGEGRIGVAPMKSQIGDVIFIPFGARTPWVLRRVRVEQHGEDAHRQDVANSYSSAGDADEMDYQLIGECYVHGVMSGELLQEDAGSSVETTATDHESRDDDQDANHRASFEELEHESEQEHERVEPGQDAKLTQEVPGGIYVRLH